jgi:hypothetical protein
MAGASRTPLLWNRHLPLFWSSSGKSNTIGWTAHQAIKLHDAQDRPIFDTAIIVTDRGIHAN